MVSASPGEGRLIPWFPGSAAELESWPEKAEDFALFAKLTIT